MREATPVLVPRENVNDETVTLVSWYVASGTLVSQGQPIAQIETSKTVLEIEAPVSGVIRYAIGEGDEVGIGAEICQIGDDAAEPARNGDAPFISGAVASAPTGTSLSSAPAVIAHGDNASIVRAGDHVTVDAPPQSTRFSRQAAELIRQLGLEPEQFASRGRVRTRDIVQAVGEAGAPAEASLLPETEAERAEPERARRGPLTQPASAGSSEAIEPAPVADVGVAVRS
jgi:pyruvate/2-oxoglutarate dehydrogenase complex dihydrolipoamide acyltransferase (E2) component